MKNKNSILDSIKDDAMLNPQDVADLLDLKLSTVYKLCKEKKIGHFQYPGGRGAIKFRKQDIEDFLKASRVEPEYGE